VNHKEAQEQLRKCMELLIEYFRKYDDDWLLSYINDVCEGTNEPPDVQVIQWR